jgi:hypothetical protein
MTDIENLEISIKALTAYSVGQPIIKDMLKKLDNINNELKKVSRVELPVIARLELPVNTNLAPQFIAKVKEIGAKIINVIEIKSSPMKPEDGILLYIIETDKEDLITDYAFYTWIKNENFQKYYKVQ